MSETQVKVGHTPGPWTHDPVHYGDVDGPRGQNICFVTDVTDVNRSVRLFPRGGDNAVSVEEAHANARLIAAAPELLEALREHRDYAASGIEPPQSVWDATHAAIAKAEGIA